MMSNEMLKKDEQVASLTLTGPSISGSVTVPLAELDKMRSDHINAIKAAQKLAENQASIKIIVVEDISKPEKYASGKAGTFIKQGFREISVTYKNLDEVKHLIMEDLRKVLHTEMEAANRAAEDWSKAAANSETMLAARIAEINVLHSDKAILKTEKERLESEVKILNDKNVKSEKVIDDVSASFTEYKEKTEKTISELRKELLETQEAKSIRIKIKNWLS